MNILLHQPFDTAYNTPPFSKIYNENFKPAFLKAIEEAKNEINQIIDNNEFPNFNNTIKALKISGEKLNRISSIFFNLNSAETNDEIQKIAQEVSPLLAEFSNDIILNQDLFKKVKTIYEQTDFSTLNCEQSMLLKKTYKDFVRNGALLQDEKKIILREIDKKLAQLSLLFGQNVLTETNNFFMHITKETELKGLPKYVIDLAKQEADSRELSGWVFTLQMPSYLPFMKYADNRPLRKKLFLAQGKKAFQNNDKNNTDIIKSIVSLRQNRAELLGYKTHADFVLEERMAKSTEAVDDFLNDLLEKSFPFAKRDVQILQDFAEKSDNIKQIMPWDHAYYTEKVKKATLDLSDDELKPYFELYQVLNGAFEIANKLYGINFIETKEIDTYHSDVRVFKVKDKDQNITGILYTDFFPRKGKRAGAWMTSYRNGSFVNGVHKIPQISIVCNFTKPSKNQPSLLTFNEVTTLFHEFGHALHGLLANTEYESLSGTNVYWDFVELPSQFMENYCYEPEALALFAKHFESRELIPKKLVDKIVKSSQFMEGYQTVRQISFGKLDMAWHSKNTKNIENIDAYEKEAFNGTKVYPDIKETNMSTSFSHIFQGGYAAGYYSYKWAEVLDADAFDFFKQNGIFDSKTAEKFKTLLSSGGTKDPMELYIEFRGKKPDNKSLLKRAGLV